MKITDNTELDEQCKQFMENFHKLPRQYQEWFCIAISESEPEYGAMMQTVTKENERQWLMEIREIFRDAREAEA